MLGQSRLKLPECDLHPGHQFAQASDGEHAVAPNKACRSLARWQHHSHSGSPRGSSPAFDGRCQYSMYAKLRLCEPGLYANLHRIGSRRWLLQRADRSPHGGADFHANRCPNSNTNQRTDDESDGCPSMHCWNACMRSNLRHLRRSRSEREPRIHNEQRRPKLSLHMQLRIHFPQHRIFYGQQLRSHTGSNSTADSRT